MPPEIWGPLRLPSSPHPTGNSVFFQLPMVTWLAVPAGQSAACDFTLGWIIT